MLSINLIFANLMCWSDAILSCQPFAILQSPTSLPTSLSSPSMWVSHTATTLCLSFIWQLGPQLCNGGVGFPPHHSTMLSISYLNLLIWCAGLMQFFSLCFIDRGEAPDCAASQSFFRKITKRYFVETNRTYHNILSFGDAEDHEQNAGWMSAWS